MSSQPIRDTFLPYGRQKIDDKDIQAVIDVLTSDYVTTGPEVVHFEQAVADYVGAKYAVAFSNGTAALHGACFAAGIGKGDEVITSPLTFVASANCVLYQQGVPIFADIDPQTYNIDPVQIEKHITKRTTAIIPVDFTGQPAELEQICEIARRHNLVVIEDAAHALGAVYRGERVGSISDMTMFSFHPVKHITSGEGGIITTNSEDYYQKLIQFRSHGITRSREQLENDHGPWYYEMQFLGFNYRMSDIQAALGRSQLNKLDEFISKRKQIIELYNQSFRDITGVQIPVQSSNTVSSWHLYILRIDSTKFDRREIFNAFLDNNIGVNVHYIPVYFQPYYQQLGYEKGLCPVAEEVYQTIITLPLFPSMAEKDVQDVITAVHHILN
ncbi:UDP-4-amino-4,6-dideoxy-N-acetyl-beta-L-altrosamine transaminase [Gracilibacillus alcaliphilus]|uniref:UDP-4-amino-4, 6-dideoxy-N-acetyl-beta-L-altrosamine transaminase n=1 Tax=Gracilibacillus alcaliphilus TaxID=1401441 RepID=UPI00195DA871|nr:UDP-4-amino-4,6-dideoxy-N-acetyl-beta-L-altrosamine transaminase [Gracilibacillus alcaliphilus]MBM7676023.1 UDP-4-amino-4,6-dideoxy-N-acetyl-beta-L-altrosamine transaminase [Gracilibacillus alcaliphilus]